METPTQTTPKEGEPEVEALDWGNDKTVLADRVTGGWIMSDLTFEVEEMQ